MRTPEPKKGTITVGRFRSMHYADLIQIEEPLLIEGFSGKVIAALVPYEQYLTMQNSNAVDRVKQIMNERDPKKLNQVPLDENGDPVS